jgi:hypothetical protein
MDLKSIDCLDPAAETLADLITGQKRFLAVAIADR